MTIVLACLVIAVIGLLVAVIADRVPISAVHKPVTSDSFPGVAPGPLDATDLNDLRFDVVVRGYKMAQVDEIIGRLQTELASRDSIRAEAEPSAPAEEEVHDGDI